MSSEVLQECILQMVQIFLKYWGPGKIPYLYAFGAILDPRTKLNTLSQIFEYLTDIFNDPENVNYNNDYDRMEAKFVEVYRLYAAKYGRADEEQPQQRQQRSPQPKLAFGALRN